MANHAPYALDTFRRPSDIPCLAWLPLSYARERCQEWLKRFDNGAILARRAQKEFEASQANPDQPPRHLLRPTGPSVELSKVPNREKRSTVVSKQLARHFFLPKATRDCGSDARRFLLTLRQKQSATVWKSTSVSGACGEEPTSPRHRAGVRTRRKFDFHTGRRSRRSFCGAGRSGIARSSRLP